MKWKPFSLNGVTYDLSHLHDRQQKFTIPAKGDKPEQVFEVDVEFGLHCFTSGVKPGQLLNPLLKYCDSRECRNFDIHRYHLSKGIPAIVDELSRRRCFHSGKGNFFLVELVDDQGQKHEYEIYFAMSKSGRGNGVLNLFVQSAYIRTTGNQPIKKPIGFNVLLYNTQQGKPIKAPPK